MKIYIALICVEYEGCDVDGVYTSENEALKHEFSYGDYQKIQVWDVEKGICVETIEID